MRNLTELFEYLKNTSHEDLLKEVKIVLNDDIEEVVAGIGRWNSIFTYLNYFLMIPKPINKEQNDDILTIEEVSAFLKINEKTVRKLIKQRKIEAFAIGTIDKQDARGTIRVRKSACEDFLLSCKI